MKAMSDHIVELPYANRDDAGRLLAERLRSRAWTNVLVLALPRGGVPVAAPVAEALDAPLDALQVRKLGVPGHEELAMGAIATGGQRVLNREVIQALDIPPEAIEQAAVRAQEELERRERAYRGDRPFPRVEGRSVILIDDGLATGSTMEVAVRAMQERGAERIIVAAPVAPPTTVAALEAVADEVVCPAMPARFRAVGEWYDDFNPISDEEVRELLERAWHDRPAE